MTSQRRALSPPSWLTWLAAGGGLACVLVAGCALDVSHPNRCGPEGECPAGRACYEGFCVARSVDPSLPFDGGSEPAEDGGGAARSDGGSGDQPGIRCVSGETCVNGQLALCSDGDIVGARACEAAGECRVARCEAGRGCVSAEAPDDTPCSGGSCQGGVCAPAQACTSSDCKTTCEAGAACTLDCASSSNCDARCERDTTCDVRCGEASNCEVKCQGDCSVACEEASNCRTECTDRGRCDIACSDEGNCEKIRCRHGAECVLRCARSEDCGFEYCDGAVIACSATLKVCNRACP
jgi:hypothetical protein